MVLVLKLLLVLYIFLAFFVFGGYIVNKFIGVKALTGEFVFFGCTVGIGLLSMVIYLVGLLHGLYISTLLVLSTILSGFVLYRINVKVISQRVRTQLGKLVRYVLEHPGIFVLGMMYVVVVSSFFLLTLYPPTVWDSIMYHLPLAKLYSTEHGILYTPYIRYSFAPQGNEMLFTIVFLLGLPAFVAQCVEWIVFLLVLYGTYLLGYRYFSSRYVGLLAASLFLALPVNLQTGTSALIDHWVVLFGVSALLSTRRLLRRSNCNNRWTAMSFMFIGFASTGKYTGLLVGVTLAISLIVFARLPIRQWFLCMGIVTVIALPWYLRTFIITGNPVYPMATSIFGNRGPWTNYQIQYQMESFSNSGVLAKKLLLNLSDLYHQFVAQYGIPSGVPYIIGIGVMICMLTTSMWDLRRRQFLLVTMVLFGAGWVAASFELRYGLFTMPILTNMAAFGIIYILQKIFLYRPNHSMLAAMITCSLLAFTWNLQFIKQFVQNNGLPPITQTWTDGWLNRALSDYSFYAFLNRTHGSRYTLYAVFDERMNFYCNGTFIGDWFGKPGYSEVLGPQLGKNNTIDGATLHSRLATFRVQFLLLTPGAEYLHDISYFNNFFRLVMKNNDGELYEVQ